MIKAEDRNCVNDPLEENAPSYKLTNLGGFIKRRCVYLIGQLDDWEERGLGQKDNSVWGHLPDGFGSSGTKFNKEVSFCESNDPASCTEAIRLAKKASGSTHPDWINA